MYLEDAQILDKVRRTLNRQVEYQRRGMRGAEASGTKGSPFWTECYRTKALLNMIQRELAPLFKTATGTITCERDR